MLARSQEPLGIVLVKRVGNRICDEERVEEVKTKSGA